jgi:hypothetical protein
MAPPTPYIVQAFEERGGGIVVPVQPKVCPSAGSARALGARLAPTHAGVIAWSRTGAPDLGSRSTCVKPSQHAAFPASGARGGENELVRRAGCKIVHLVLGQLHQSSALSSLRDDLSHHIA